MKLYHGGKEYDLTPEEAEKVREAIKQKQRTVEIRSMVVWLSDEPYDPWLEL